MKIELPAETAAVDQPVASTIPLIKVANEPRIVIWNNTITNAAPVTDQPENFTLFSLIFIPPNRTFKEEEKPLPSSRLKDLSKLADESTGLYLIVFRTGNNFILYRFPKLAPISTESGNTNHQFTVVFRMLLGVAEHIRVNDVELYVIAAIIEV